MVVRRESGFLIGTALAVALGLAVSSSGQTPPAAATPPPACASPAHRQFDFWVGQWDVYRPDTNAQVATSLIENLYDNCAIRENWMPFKGTAGGSINVYRPKSGEWLQVWTDGANELHTYHGRWTGKIMEFEGEAKDAADVGRKVKMTYEPMPDGSVVQTGYNWSDKGWVLNYQFSYRKARAG